MPDNRSTVDPCHPLPRDVLELLAAIDALPEEYRQAFEPVTQRIIEGSWRRRQILATIQEAISQLRLDMKYLMFDLEATRRERDSLREQLE